MKNFTPWTLFAESTKKYPQNILLIHSRKQQTYSEVFEEINRISERIRKLDFRMGGIYLPNGTAFIDWLLAFSKENKVVLPISYQIKGEAFAELADFSDAEVIVTDRKGYEEIKKHLNRLQLKGVFVLDEEEGCEYIEIKPGIKKNTALREDTFCICFTSGSTGKPKGIVLSNAAICGNSLAVAQYINFSSQERTIIPRSMAQASPISGDILMTVSRGGAIIILNDLFHPAIFLKAIEEYQATNVFMIRTMLAQILDYPKLAEYNTTSMKRIMLGGMLNPKHIFIEGTKKFPHIGFFNAYGLSEVSARAAFLSPEDMNQKLGAIGKPIMGCKLKIVKENGEDGEPGETGEIYVQSDYVMDGYYKDPQLTRETILSGWLRSGDKGYRDEEDFFYVIGRLDDLIIQGGTKVYPMEIEEALLKNEHISEVVVMGPADNILGQRIVVLVKPHSGCSMTEKEIYQWCRTKLEDKKLPKEIYIVEDIPRNAVGKISKPQVRQIYEMKMKEKLPR